MKKQGRTIGKVTRDAIKEVEQRVLAREGRKSIKAKVGHAKRVAKKALKAGVVAGAIVATAVIVRERRKRRDLIG